MKLILITAPYYFVEETALLKAFFEEGLDVLHLCKPDTPLLYTERFLALIPEKYHKRIVLHDHFQLKEEYKLKGIHLSDRNPFIPEKYKGFISATCHTAEEVKLDKINCNYVFLSNIYNSLSCPEQFATHTTTELLQYQAEGIIDKRVIALGGITHENIHEMKELGFGGIAVQGAIWTRFQHESSCEYGEIIQYFKQLRKLAD